VSNGGEAGPVLVTGAAGFIGSHLVDRLLADGFRVVGVDDLSTGRRSNLDGAAQQPAFDLAELDITSAAFRALVADVRPRAVLHLAAQMDVRKSVADPLHDARVNVLGTVNVLEAAVRSATPRVVFASSGGTVYGEPDSPRVREDAPLRPAAPYGAAKAAGEMYVQMYQRLYGIAGTSLALGNVYGPRQDPHGEAGVVSIFARALGSGAGTTIFGDGTSARDYIYISDVVDAFVHCLSGQGTATRYNVGTGEATTVRELHRLLAELCGTADDPAWAPARLGELHTISLDSSALTEDTGWRAEVPLAEGLRDTVDWVRATLDPADSRPAG
jgi:UDP-glucose 4-epimerase